jgi:hypothetical protein
VVYVLTERSFCPRECLAKWHRMEMGKELTQQQVGYIVFGNNVLAKDLHYP